MANIGTWGTMVEMFAMATILNKPIYIFTKQGNYNKWLKYKSLIPDDKDIHSDEVIMMSNISGFHFEPVLF